MKRNPLGEAPFTPSVLGLGALHFGVFLDLDESVLQIRRALELGMNFIETAPMYGRGNSEAFVGRAIKGRRHEVLLSTKVGLAPTELSDGTFGVTGVPLSKQRIRTSLEQSLRALGTDYIDLYQIHAYDPCTPLEETLETLHSLVQEGKIRSIGCSNYSAEEFQQTLDADSDCHWARLDSFQVHYNMIERKAEDDLVPLCSRNNVGMICNRALARGILGGRYRANEPPPPDSRGATSHRVSRWLQASTINTVQALDGFAKGMGWSVSQVALAWLIDRPGVSVALVGTRNLSQLEKCAMATELKLSDQDRLAIDRIIGEMGIMDQVKALPEVFFEK